ncbi:hypothetical protein DV451_005066 [Geotrichum candidum]|uniref:Uncharacterized protein n=1 Tax=Geotrichum candidum TaxID=1173061 RepID=A0A9P5KRJ9_GEOCN|nr:hypothetical protein DV451_005066 [Geotrichum candidum]KAF5106426.1 hypothetical protein DV453_003917 [Geotrichum candidum]
MLVLLVIIIIVIKQFEHTLNKFFHKHVLLAATHAKFTQFFERNPPSGLTALFARDFWVVEDIGYCS